MKILDKPSQILNVRHTTSQCHSLTVTRLQVRKTKHQVRRTKHQVRQTKHQVCQTKHQVRQTKHQVCNLLLIPVEIVEIKNVNLHSKILIHAVLWTDNFCRKFTHFFGVPFTGLKNVVAYQKLQL